MNGVVNPRRVSDTKAHLALSLPDQEVHLPTPSVETHVRPSIHEACASVWEPLTLWFVGAGGGGEVSGHTVMWGHLSPDDIIRERRCSWSIQSVNWREEVS